MSLFHDPYHFLQQSRGTQTTFFPVPKRKRKKKGEDNDFFDDIDPFTGVPDGFYRAFAIQSPLEQLPVIVQNRVGEGEARLEREYNSVETQTEERPSESIGRPATTQSPSPSEANPIPLPRPRGNTFSEDEDTPPKSEKSSASLRRSSRQTSKSGRQGRGNRKRSGEQ